MKKLLTFILLISANSFGQCPQANDTLITSDCLNATITPQQGLNHNITIYDKNGLETGQTFWYTSSSFTFPFDSTHTYSFITQDVCLNGDTSVQSIQKDWIPPCPIQQLQLLPNPTSVNNINIQFTSVASGHGWLFVGNRPQRINVSTGINSYHVHRNLSSGTYPVNIIFKGKSFTKQLIIL